MKLNRRQLRKIINEAIKDVASSKYQFVEILQKAGEKCGFVSEVDKIISSYPNKNMEDMTTVSFLNKSNKEFKSGYKNYDMGRTGEGALDIQAFKNEDKDKFINAMVKADGRVGKILEDPNVILNASAEPAAGGVSFVIRVTNKHNFND